MLFDDRAGPFRKVADTDIVTDSITVPSVLDKAPSGNGVVELQSLEGGDLPKRLLLMPISKGAADDTYTLAIYGWRRTNGRGSKAAYVPITLGSFACTAGSKTGVAGTDVDTTYFFADTITMTANYGVANVTNVIISPAQNEYASIELYTRGCSILSFLMDLGTTPTAMNVLMATL